MAFCCCCYCFRRCFLSYLGTSTASWLWRHGLAGRRAKRTWPPYTPPTGLATSTMVNCVPSKEEAEMQEHDTGKCGAARFFILSSPFRHYIMSLRLEFCVLKSFISLLYCVSRWSQDGSMHMMHTNTHTQF